MNWILHIRTYWCKILLDCLHDTLHGADLEDDDDVNQLEGEESRFQHLLLDLLDFCRLWPLSVPRTPRYAWAMSSPSNWNYSLTHHNHHIFLISWKSIRILLELQYCKNTMLEWTIYLDTDMDVASTLSTRPHPPPQPASFFHYLFHFIRYHQHLNIINVHVRR